MHFDAVARGDCGNPQRPATCHRMPPRRIDFPISVSDLIVVWCPPHIWFQGAPEQFATVPDIGNEGAAPSIDGHLPIIASDQVAFAGMLKERGVSFFG